MFEEPAENKLLKLLKEGAMREAQEDEGVPQETDNRLLRILRDKRKKTTFEGDSEPPPRRPERRPPEARKVRPEGGSEAAPAPAAEERRPAPAPEPARRVDSASRAEARRILEAARAEDASTTRAPMARPEDASTSGDEAADSLREMVRAAALPAAEAVKPASRATPAPEPAAPPPAKSQPPPAKPQPPPAKSQPAAPPAPRAPVSPRGRVAEPYLATDGGLALTLLLKGDQIQFLVKMAESGQSGSMIRLMVVAQNLMGGQGEWGLAGLLQEYARTLNGVLNKLMLQERMKKEVDIGTLKDPDLDALLEEIRDSLEAEELSTGLEDAAAPAEGLLLGVRLSKEDVAFLRKLATPKGDLTLVGHLLFTQALMTHEIVGHSPWPQGPAATRIREDFKKAVQNFRELQKTLLNQILVNARLKKKTSWGANAAKHEAALSELARTLKACLPGAQG